VHVVHRSGYKVAGLNTSRSPARDDLLLGYRLTSDTIMLPSNGSDLSIAGTTGAYEEGMQRQANDSCQEASIQACAKARTRVCKNFNILVSTF